MYRREHLYNHKCLCYSISLRHPVDQFIEMCVAFALRVNYASFIPIKIRKPLCPRATKVDMYVFAIYRLSMRLNKYFSAFPSASVLKQD